MVTVQHNLDELNAALRDYVRLSGKSVEEALKKQGAKLGFNLRQELRGLMPAKGSIRTAMLDRLASHRGIKIRPSVLKKIFGRKGSSSLFISQRTANKLGATTANSKGRRVNLWAQAIKNEINIRESGRGFLGVSASYPGIRGMLESAKAVSRFGPVLSRAGFKATGSGGAIEFQWGGLGGNLTTSAAEGLTKAKGEAAIDRALAGTLEDIEVYLTRKLQEAWAK